MESDKPHRLFLLVPTSENSDQWHPVASGNGLFELEKLATKLNCVNRWKVVQPMRGNTPGGAGSITLKQYPKR